MVADHTGYTHHDHGHADLRLEFANAALECPWVIYVRVCVMALWFAGLGFGDLRRAPLRLLPDHHRSHRLVRPRVHDCVGDLCAAGRVCGVHVRGWRESVCGEGVGEMVATGRAARL